MTDNRAAGVVIALLLAFLLLRRAGAGGPPPPSPKEKMRAIYVWWHSYRIRQSVYYPEEQIQFFRICAAEEINTAFMLISDGDQLRQLTSAQEEVASFIRAANERGISVWAMIGGTQMATDPEAARPYIEALLQYNHDYPDARMDGLQLDIEPPGGSTAEQHAVFVGQLVNAIRQFKTFSIATPAGTETLGSQGLLLSADADPRWSLPQVEPNFRLLLRELDFVTLMAYRDTFEGVLSVAQTEVNICIQEDTAFLISQETDEFPAARALDPGWTMITNFEEGKDHLRQLQDALKEYFLVQVGTRTDLMYGFALHQYQGSVMRWHILESLAWPLIVEGDQVSVTATLRTSGGYGDVPYGVELRAWDDYGAEWRSSRVVVMEGMETRQVTFQAPAQLFQGGYHVRLSVYDIDLNEEFNQRQSRLLATDFGGDVAGLEALDLAQLLAWDPPLSGLRRPFVELDYSQPQGAQ